jgi:hypothetical protein
VSCTAALTGAVVTPGGLQIAQPRQAPQSVAKFRKIRISFPLACLNHRKGWLNQRLYICRVIGWEIIKQDQLSKTALLPCLSQATGEESLTVKVWSATTNCVAAVQRRWASRRLTTWYQRHVDPHPPALALHHPLPRPPPPPTTPSPWLSPPSRTSWS